MMIENTKLEKFDKYLSQIAIEVDAINDENFNEKMKNVNDFIKQIGKNKTELQKITSKNDYYYICDLLHNRVKLISDKFDSMIEKKKEEQLSISSELSRIVIKKKLINYQR